MAAISYAPRMSARLNLVDLGVSQARQIQANNTDSYQLDLQPLKALWESNSFREADSLELTVSFDEAGVDPRYLRSAEVVFWMDAGGDAFERTSDNLRFIGIVRDVSREFSETSKVVVIKAVDYTTLFIEAHNLPMSYMPSFSDTLRQAYKKVCLGTGLASTDPADPTSDKLVILSTVCDPDTNEPIIQLVAQGEVNLDLPMVATVDPRIAASPMIVRQSGMDPWATWTEICGQLGLITYIRGSVCIVTAATEYYTADDPPLFVYGQNVLTLTERRDYGQLTGKNLCVRSYDGMTGTMLESFYPRKNTPLATTVRKKKFILPSAKKKSQGVVGEHYEMIDLQIPVTNQAMLDEISENLWHERVRAEMSGTLTTREMFIDTTLTGQVSPGSEAFELLKLQAGDNITIQIEADALDNIQSLDGEAPKVAALLARGYTEQMAGYIIANLSSLTTQPAQFLVHSVATEFDASGSSDSYNVTIEFLNTLDVTGNVTIQIPDAPIIDGIVFDTVPDVDNNGDIIFDTTPDVINANDISFDTPPDVT